MTWQKVKSVGKATWAKLLLEKAGLRRQREREAGGRTDHSAVLPNRSRESRDLAVSGKQKAPPGAGDNIGEKPSRRTALREPFILKNVYTLTRLCATFLLRWGNEGSSRQSHAMRLLNTLSFYQVDVPLDSSEASASSVSFVKLLWCVLQDVKSFEDYGRVSGLYCRVDVSEWSVV